MRWIRNSSLTIVLVFLFLGSWVGHAIAGWHAYNDERREHEDAPVELAQYLTSGEFLETTFENWESEFLQMAAFVFLSARLLQKGAAESRKPPEEDGEVDTERVRANSPYPVRRGGWVARLYEHSLSLTFSLLFVGTWLLHAASGARAYSEEQARHGLAGVSMFGYMAEPQFWFESFQNWQSEFFATACLVVFSIYLREKDSPESKDVVAPHSQTGT